MRLDPQISRESDKTYYIAQFLIGSPHSRARGKHRDSKSSRRDPDLKDSAVDHGIVPQRLLPQVQQASH